ncbi:MAG TPA: outer membrane beta-barrel protein, partial [Opitutaceae bacterium]|nr:outer membrane beta-barrel protein [Opitutaceae bacterium]
RSNYDDSKMKLQLTAGYHELNQNTPDVRGLIRRNVLSAGGNGEVEISQITSAGGGIQVDREDYRRPGYSDSTTYTLPLNVYYKWTPKVDLSAGYRYRDYEANQNQDSTDHFFNLGARGDFTPKLSGTFAIGVNTRRFNGTTASTSRNSGTESQLGLDASFSYEISAKTNLQLGASNDFGTTPQGQQQKNFTLNAAVNSKISAEWEANAGLSYRATGYGTRTDDYYEATLGASYVINANIRIVGAYVYRRYNSDIASSEFTNNVFSLAANFRY